MNTVSPRIFRKRISMSGYLILLLLLQLFLVTAGCKKFLDEKANKSDVVPADLNDLQTLLDNDLVNQNGPPLPELLSDNYYITTSRWQARATSSNLNAQSEAYHYIWAGDPVPHNNSWSGPYQHPVYYSNVVLDYLPQVTTRPGEEEKHKQIKGAALFHRAFTFQQLAQLYCKPYSSENLEQLGLVLKLSSNVSEKPARATIQQTYDCIVADLKEAATLLPVSTTYPTRPSKPAAYGALARTYLSMRDYTNAGRYADSALQLYKELLDYNDLMPVGTPPIKTYNKEVIYQNYAGSTPVILSSSYVRIDTQLYQSYHVNDLRRELFFVQNTGANAGTQSFRGSYHGNLSASIVFDGIATDELYLIRAECHARANNTSAAMADLNTLMEKRWRSGLFSPITAGTPAEALAKILEERRKELVFRGLRWSDIRRLNLEGANITLKRIIDGVTYTLPPNDLRIVMLIPWNEINRSGIQQNPR